MAQRITQKDLEAVANRINLITKSPTEAWKIVDGKHTGQIGCYHMSYAYGGAALHRMDTTGGGVQDVLRIGHQPKKDMYHAMHAFIRGLDAGNKSV